MPRQLLITEHSDKLLQQKLKLARAELHLEQRARNSWKVQQWTKTIEMMEKEVARRIEL